EPLTLYQFDKHGNKLTLLQDEELNTLLSNLNIWTNINKIKFEDNCFHDPQLTIDQIIRFDEAVRKKFPPAHGHLNYYAHVAQRVPYIFSQLVGKERKVIDGNDNYFNQYLNDVRGDRRRFPDFDPEYLDHTHQILATVVAQANKIVEILCQVF